MIHTPVLSEPCLSIICRILKPDIVRSTVRAAIFVFSVMRFFVIEGSSRIHTIIFFSFSERGVTTPLLPFTTPLAMPLLPLTTPTAPAKVST